MNHHEQQRSENGHLLVNLDDVIANQIEMQKPLDTTDGSSRRTPIAAIQSLWQRSKGMTVKDVTESVSNSGSKCKLTDYLSTRGAGSFFCGGSPFQ